MHDALSEAADPLEVVRNIRERLEAFADEAHTILRKHESATRSRVIAVDQSRKKLHGISVRQEELLQEALDCVELGLFRAAHVSAWQAFMDFLEEKLESDDLKKVQASRPKWDWTKLKTMEDIRETFAEYQIIEVARDVKLLTKNDMKSLHGMLSTRNDCAHPSAYTPDVNETLGYVSGLINRMVRIQPKTL